MQPRIDIVDFPATTLIGLEVDFYGAMSPKFNGQEVLGPVWGTVHQKLAEIGLAFQGRMIAATRPASSGVEGLLTQFVGLEVSQIPEDLNGLSTFQLSAMKLATYEHHGPMDNLVQSLNHFYKEILPNSDYELQTPWALELEIYDERFNMKADSVMLIAAPIN